MFNKIKIAILMFKIKFWYLAAIEKLVKDPQYNEKLSEVKKKLGLNGETLKEEKPYWENLKCRVWVGYLKPIEFLLFASMFETKLLEAPMQTVCIKLDDFDEKDNYYIIIPESLKSGYSEKYLDFVIGHELGHIESGYYESIKRVNELEEDMKADVYAWEYYSKRNNEHTLPITFIFRNIISNWITDLQSEIPEVKKLLYKNNLLDVFFKYNFKIHKRINNIVYKFFVLSEDQFK